MEGVLRRELISRADFDAALRQQGGLQIEDVQIALLETTGHITNIARKST
ncbi:YetF domain-containing protein [Enterobacter hormaechei]